MAASPQFIVMTPALTGADGISEVSRAAVDALREEGVQTWTLAEPANASLPARTRGSGGSKVKFCSSALAHTGPLQDTTIIVMHVHLAPAAIPLVWRGAHMAIFLHGVECWRPLTAMEKLAIRKARRLISNSAYTGRRFQAANPEFASRSILPCHLGVVPANGPSDEKDPPYALIVGRMAAEERYKGHDVLLELWPRLLSDVPNARLIVVGEGDDRQRLQSKAVDLGLADAVKFEGRVSNERLLELYAGAAFFVMPSTGEGFGLAFLEAMRVGKPCIAGPGAAEEIVEDGVSGFIVAPDSEQLLDRVRRLFSDPLLRRNIGKAASDRFARNFTREHFRSRLRNALGLEAQVAVCAG